MMYLSFDFGSKESSVVVVSQKGIINFVFTEERYSRKKYDNSFPYNSIKSISHCHKGDLIINCGKEDNDIVNIFKSYLPTLQIEEKIDCYHHILHCYESFYTSGFNRAAVLVVDGYGNDDGNGVESISLYHKIGKQTKLLKRYYIDDSLGKFYNDAIGILKFKENEEGHFMGLSSYGTPFEKRFISFVDGKIVKNGPLLYEKYYSNKDTLECLRSTNFAATIQRDLVECLLGLVKYIKELTCEENLCLSGGVFNNVLANNAICESGIFKNIWCSPAPGDYGITVGKTYLTYEKYISDDDISFNKMKSAYLGEDYSDERMIKYLENNKIDYNEVSVIDVADLLCSNKVVAWFQGRSEFGRRALGHRSILSNPSYRSNYIRVSQKIKNRAPYRPLACTVPSELFDMMFDVKNKDLTEYMLRAIEVKMEIRDRIPACLAIDNTTRPQNLNREINPELYDMIMSFYEKTGVPCVVNTSLNGGGEPIVETLYDLIMFTKNQNEIDYIVLNGKYLIDNIKSIIGRNDFDKNDML